jgi:hypothetical protein
MKDKGENLDFLRLVKTRDLFRELGKRLNIKYGKIEMKFHQGEPSEYANIDYRVEVEKSPELKKEI